MPFGFANLHRASFPLAALARRPPARPFVLRTLVRAALSTVASGGTAALFTEHVARLAHELKTTPM